MASAEGGSVPSEVGYGEGCPLPSRLRGLEELPQRDPGQSPADNGFWRILNVQNAPFCTYVTKSEGNNLH